MAQPTFLITGSSGHLGTALSLHLGPSAIGIDIRPSPTTTHLTSLTARKAIADILDTYPSITTILHTATLHKPHIASHSKEDFVETNVKGTLVLLEEAASRSQIKSFVFVSTTSAFGSSLVSADESDGAKWIDEHVVSTPKNIYGVTKCAAEDLCRLVHVESGLPVIVLRTSRFFPEDDDDAERRDAFAPDNLKVLELTYRRVDVADVVSAVLLAAEKAPALRWAKFVVSAPSPFPRDAAVLARLTGDAGGVLRELVPGSEEVFRLVGWKFLDRIDRVYDSRRAREALGWHPEFTFERAVDRVGKGVEWRSELTLRVGKRGYHDVPTGVYTA